MNMTRSFKGSYLGLLAALAIGLQFGAGCSGSDEASTGQTAAALAGDLPTPVRITSSENILLRGLDGSDPLAAIMIDPPTSAGGSDASMLDLLAKAMQSRPPFDALSGRDITSIRVASKANDLTDRERGALTGKTTPRRDVLVATQVYRCEVQPKAGCQNYLVVDAVTGEVIESGSFGENQVSRGPA